MQKVLFLDTVHPLIEMELTEYGYRCEPGDKVSHEELVQIIDKYSGIIIRSRIFLDEELLSKATSLKWIGRVGAGMESIDTAYAASKGILCLNSPEGNRDAVGEHALGILLSLMNHINRADREVRNGQWIREGNRGTEIKGKTVAIIGYGNMGSAFAQRLKGFDADVISYDKYKNDYADRNTREVTMDEVFEKADILSLHVPLTDETRHLVNSHYLEKFKKNIRLLNTSRGPVVDTAALVTALESGKVLGAALDVLEMEEGSFEKISFQDNDAFRYLAASDKVVMTPHIAGWTLESNIKLAQVLVNKIKSAFPQI